MCFLIKVFCHFSKSSSFRPTSTSDGNFNYARCSEYYTRKVKYFDSIKILYALDFSNRKSRQSKANIWDFLIIASLCSKQY